jgi:hypothetical protein
MTEAATSVPAMTERRALLLETIVLPVLFLSIALAGGLRVTAAGEMRLLPPTLFSLVLGALLTGALVQSGALRLSRLLGRDSLLELASGLVLVAAIFAASAQILNGLVPEHGLLAVLFNLFFAVLLSNTIAAEPTPTRLLRSLGVTFAWALVMKYVFLPGLAAPDAHWGARLVSLLMRGATLGSVPVDPWPPAVGYLMFGAAALYLLGLWLLAYTGSPINRIASAD